MNDASAAGDPLRSVAALLEIRAADTGGRAAFIEGATGRTLTWDDLHVEAERWQRVAASFDGGRVGLVIADPLRTIAAYLGAIAAGMTVAPFNPAITAHELAVQDQALGLDAVVTDGDPERLRPALAHPALWSTDDDGLRVDVEGGLSRRPSAPGATGAALVLATSGTTGTPKIIPLSEVNLLHTAASLIANHALSSEDRGYCPLPLFHINALVVGVLATVVRGSSLVVDRRFSARGFWATVDRHQVTWLNLVPAIITVLSEGTGPRDGQARRVEFARSASAPLPLATRERFEQRCGIGVIETYGMTEAASQIAANPRHLPDRRPGSVGRPVGLELRVVDETGDAVPADSVGEVQIRGRNVVQHYWEPAGSERMSRPAVDADGWLATGDVGRLDADGYVYLVGRGDDVINRGGEKLYPREIEEVLLADPAVSAAAVVGRPHPTVGEEPVAFVITGPDAGTDDVGLAARLAARCDELLSHFKRPADIIVADQLPSGPTGKIRHAELRRVLAAAETGA